MHPGGARVSAQSRRRPAAFLDRDGTIIKDANYVRDPADVELLPGAAEAVRRLNDRGIPVIVVTNQSGIARGWLTTGDYEAVRGRVDELLAAAGARVETTYMCPHHPDITGVCDCRKPGTALYARAVADHDLDASRSLFCGDRWRDVAPSGVLGGLAVLLDVPSTPADDRERARMDGITTAPSLAAAVDLYFDFLDTLPP